MGGQLVYCYIFFFSSRRRHTRFKCDWSSDVCSSDLFQSGEAYALVNLGGLYQDLQLYDRSLAVTEDGLALARQLQDSYLTNCALYVMAMTYLLTGDTETATFLASEASQGTPSRRNGGHAKARRELVHTLLLLHQQRYDEASTCLADLEAYLLSIGLQWEWLCTSLRLAACQLMRGQTSEALRRIDEMTTLILRADYEQLVLKELRNFPVLEHAF